MIESKKIDEVVHRIADNFDPDKIILFGSYALGEPGTDSDLDLLIIKNSDQPRHRRSFEIRKALMGLMIPMDILVYTTEEFDREVNEKYSFISHVIKTSKVLYERNSEIKYRMMNK